MDVIQFTSDIMPYGEHTIKLANRNEMYEISKIAFWPALKAKKINVGDFTQSNNGWEEQNDEVNGRRIYSKLANAKLSRSVTLSKFWVYGTKCGLHDRIKVKFGGIEEIISENEVFEGNEDYKRRRDNVLLYESETLPLSTNNIEISAVSSTAITLGNFYYLDEPEVPPVSVPVTQMEVSGRYGDGNTPCTNDYLSPTCGHRYWSESDKNLNFSLRFMGEKFIVVGTNSESHGKYQIYLDGEFYAEVDQKGPRALYQVQFTSETLEYGWHDLKLVCVGEIYEIYKVGY